MIQPGGQLDTRIRPNEDEGQLPAERAQVQLLQDLPVPVLEAEHAEGIKLLAETQNQPQLPPPVSSSRKGLEGTFLGS